MGSMEDLSVRRGLSNRGSDHTGHVGEIGPSTTRMATRSSVVNSLVSHVLQSPTKASSLIAKPSELFIFASSDSVKKEDISSSCSACPSSLSSSSSSSFFAKDGTCMNDNHTNNYMTFHHRYDSIKDDLSPSVPSASPSSLILPSSSSSSLCSLPSSSSSSSDLFMCSSSPSQCSSSQSSCLPLQHFSSVAAAAPFSASLQGSSPSLLQGFSLQASSSLPQNFSASCSNNFVIHDGNSSVTQNSYEQQQQQQQQQDISLEDCYSSNEPGLHGGGLVLSKSTEAAKILQCLNPLKEINGGGNNCNTNNNNNNNNNCRLKFEKNFIERVSSTESTCSVSSRDSMSESSVGKMISDLQRTELHSGNSNNNSSASEIASDLLALTNNHHQQQQHYLSHIPPSHSHYNYTTFSSTSSSGKHVPISSSSSFQVVCEAQSILQSLGMEQYIPAFLNEGFETAEDLKAATEWDYEAMEVKLAHRRRIQQTAINVCATNPRPLPSTLFTAATTTTTTTTATATTSNASATTSNTSTTVLTTVTAASVATATSALARLRASGGAGLPPWLESTTGLEYLMTPEQEWTDAAVKRRRDVDVDSPSIADYFAGWDGSEGDRPSNMRKKTRPNFTSRQYEPMRHWFVSHIPNVERPSNRDKKFLEEATGLTRERVVRWISNNRIRSYLPDKEELDEYAELRNNETDPSKRDTYFGIMYSRLFDKQRDMKHRQYDDEELSYPESV